MPVDLDLSSICIFKLVIFLLVKCLIHMEEGHKTYVQVKQQLQSNIYESLRPSENCHMPPQSEQTLPHQT